MKLRPWSVATSLLLSASLLQAQNHASVNINVKETEGIRRSAYPVNSRVPLPKGSLKDMSHAHLLFNDKETAVQVTAETRWPDDSIQWLDVDFNATIGPSEEQVYRLEYGDDIKSSAAARGLTVSQAPDAIQVGNVRLGKTASPLVLSVSYRQEDIGKGLNGFSVTDNTGAAHELNASDLKVEVVKPGPLYVMVRYTGRLTVAAGATLPFTITVEMPNSKTWVKYTAAVDDPSRRLRDISFNSPIAFGAAPWLWDFGTGSWTYGSFRNPTDSAVLTQVVKSTGNDWQVRNGPRGQEQLYETSAGDRPRVAEGWGHFQDGKEVIAFGFANFGKVAGIYSVALDGQGQESFRFTLSQPASHHELSIYQHYVASPTPIGAVTSPVSMLHPLVAACDKDQYTRSGVPVP